jgi:hypothetical protein
MHGLLRNKLSGQLFFRMNMFLNVKLKTQSCEFENELKSANQALKEEIKTFRYFFCIFVI